MAESIEPISLGQTKGEKGRKRSPCEIDRASDPCALVIFGASGDLAERKLIPSLYRLFSNGLLPEEFLIVGTGRKELSADRFREIMGEAVRRESDAPPDPESLAAFLSTLSYHPLAYDDATSYEGLASRLDALERVGIPGGNRIYYLATPPSVSPVIVGHLGLPGLNSEETGWRRLILEKPFGRDLATAGELSRLVHRHFREEQIFRIDHYLGKETVQDILMFRFANLIFEPVWNRQYIDHVQITAAESLGIEHRAGYYEGAGVLRDMFQNHMLQLAALIAMEPPVHFDADSVMDEKMKIFRSIRPIPLNRLDEHLVIGQYRRSATDGVHAAGYLEEPGVAKASRTPTYAALKLQIDNWRWKGVPFYLRSGKRLTRRVTEIAIFFRHVPHLLFGGRLDREISQNVLVFTIQPDEGITLTLQTKIPGTKVCLREVVMDFRYSEFYSGTKKVDAYERVLVDCLSGDHTLFVREDGVAASWGLLTPVLEMIEGAGSPFALETYPAGSSGPTQADILMEREGRRWRPL